MKILWDEKKRKINLEKHGLDFAGLSFGFLEKATIEQSYSNRFMAIFEFHDKTILVVFKFLGTEALSIISMRPANKKERGLLK